VLQIPATARGRATTPRATVAPVVAKPVASRARRIRMFASVRTTSIRRHEH
jgi:hypothetical protein